MNTRFALSMLALTAAVCLLLILRRQDNIASGGDASMGYQCLNWSGPGTAVKVMAAWQKDSKKTAAVRTIVNTDYVLIGLYVLYLCGSLYYRAKKEGRRSWLRKWLWAGVALILAGALVDVVQDYTISVGISGTRLPDLRWFTYPKWVCLATGVLPLLVSLMPGNFFSKATGQAVLVYLSGLLKSIWMFFPSLLFIFLTIFAFWLTGQGQDLITAFSEKRSHVWAGYNWAQPLFFIAIAFWVYVSWYSSRIISYIKEERQKALVVKALAMGDVFFGISQTFLEDFPRVVGNTCFLVLELAALQSPMLSGPVNSSEGFVLLAISLIGLYFVDRWVREKCSESPLLEPIFWITLGLFGVLLLVLPFQNYSHGTFIWWLFVLLLLFHAVFILYTNLRRVKVSHAIAAGRAEKKRLAAQAAMASGTTKLVVPAKKSWPLRVMDFFCIPEEEKGYCKWFLYVSVPAFLAYFAAIYFLGFARALGPFPFVILAFAVLLAFGNTVTAFSVRYRTSFHFILLILAFSIGMQESHYVRTIKLKGGAVNGYPNRPTLKSYLAAWLDKQPALLKSSTDSCDIYFVLADGGASRSGYWTASVLGRLQDTLPPDRNGLLFSDHVFCLSGTSGGGVGLAAFFGQLRGQPAQPGKSYTNTARDFLSQDFFTYTVARMLGPDFFNYIFHFTSEKDRGAALEESLEESAKAMAGNDYAVAFDDTLSKFKAFEGGGVSLPILFINTTRMQDGTPGVVSNIFPDSSIYDNRVDALGLLASTQDISLASGAILGARFPYLSPAGRIGNNYFVDGGYFDNSGAGAVQETLRAIFNIARDDAKKGGAIFQKLRRLRFKVLHIVNSPLDDPAALKKVAPIANDLFAPVTTIVGAHDVQTSVNDSRLTHYIDDLKKYDSINAEYTLVSLYDDSTEWRNDPLHGRFDKEPPYAMNWFMSDTTKRRIDERLERNTAVKNLIGKTVTRTK